MASIILYVDDEAAPPPLESELERRGQELVQTQDPEEVLSLVASGGPVLVFLELQLAGCDGLALLESISSAQPDLPVVVVTRGSDADLYPRALELGCRDFLTKPVLPSQLLACAYDLAGQAPDRPVDTRDDEAPESDAGAELSAEVGGLSFAELFQELHEAGFSGVVVASRAGRRNGVELRNGTPVAASSNAGRERLEDFLLRRGTIDQEQHDRLVDQVADGVGRVEDVLITMEIVTEEEMQAARAEQGREVLLEPFGWRDASHRVLPGKRLKADTALPLECSAFAALLEGVLERVPDEQVSAWLDRSRALYASEGAHAERDGVILPPEHAGLVASLQGESTLAEIVASGEAEARPLCALTLAGALDLHTEPVLVLSEALMPLAPEPEAPPQAEPPLDEEPAHLDEEAAAPDEECAPTAEEAAPIDQDEAPLDEEPTVAPGGEAPLRERVTIPREREVERRLAELTALSEHLSGRDDFAVLEVSEESPDEDVQRAYQAKLSLEPLNPPAELADEPELAELVKKVRTRLSDAYKHLRTQDRRRVHALLNKTPRAESVAPERALDAEGWFRKGEAFLRGRSYDKAVEALGMAVHYDPEQGEYLSHLGYALYLSNPRNDLVRREAMEHMAKGIKLSPEQPLSYVYLGRALKAGDDLRNAKRMFRRALKIDSDFHPALQELRLLDTRRDKDKKSGMLGRLRKP